MVCATAGSPRWGRMAKLQKILLFLYFNHSEGSLMATPR